MLNGTVPGLSDSHEEQHLPAATCVGSAAKPAAGGPSWWKSFWSMPGKPEKFLGWPATIFILTQLAGGLPLLPYAMLHWQAENSLKFACFLGVALSASLFKVRLPGIQATMSANFLFILVGILDLSYPETILMGCLGGLVQSLWQAKPRPRLVQLFFNFANLSISIAAANAVFHSQIAYRFGFRWPLLLAAASTTYFAMNTMSVSGIIAMAEPAGRSRMPGSKRSRHRNIEDSQGMVH